MWFKCCIPLKRMSIIFFKIQNMSIKCHHTVTVITLVLLSVYCCLTTVVFNWQVYQLPSKLLLKYCSVKIKLLSNYCTVWWHFIDIYCMTQTAYHNSRKLHHTDYLNIMIYHPALSTVIVIIVISQVYQRICWYSQCKHGP